MKEKILNGPDSQPVEIRTEGGPYPCNLPTGMDTSPRYMARTEADGGELLADGSAFLPGLVILEVQRNLIKGPGHTR
jgi:hypothetical protein